MNRSKEIIEAVPQNLHDEYRKRMIHYGIVAASIAITFGALITGAATHPENIDTLGWLWMSTYIPAMPSIWLNTRGLERLKHINVSGPSTTYTHVESKGRSRWSLRLLPGR